MAKFNHSHYEKNDPVYLNNEAYSQPKEYFKKIGSYIKNRFDEEPISIVDMGCASGAFLNYIINEINVESATGVDISDKHLMLAKKVMPEISFIEGSVLDVKKLNLPKHNVCTFLGTMSIFDEIDIVLNNLIKLIKKNGVLYIYDLINNEPVDMIMRYKKFSNESSSEWNSALSVRSKETYKNAINKINNKLTVNFYDFEMPFQIEKTDDPMRAWTIETSESKNQLVVGTGQMLNFNIIEIMSLK